MEGTKRIKSWSFHQYSRNSEGETTWISLVGWPHKTSNVYLGQVHSLPRYLIQFTLLGIQLTHHWSEVDQHCYPLFWWNFFFFQKQNNFGTELLCHRCSRYPENIIKYIKLIMLGVRLLFQWQLLVILFWLFVWWEGEGGRLKDENKNEWILI